MNKAGFATVNPSTGEEIEAFSYFTPAQTEKVVARADKSFQSFRELPVHKRAQLFTDLGNTLRKNKVQLAKVISTEMGKIFSEAEAEIEKCAHGSLSGQGEPSSEIRGTRAAHRCRYDTLPWHEKTSRCWRARPGSGDRGFGYRWTRRVCRSVRPTAQKWCEGRRFRPQSRQARYREELWSRSYNQHQGQVLKRYCQGTQQHHGPG